MQEIRTKGVTIIMLGMSDRIGQTNHSNSTNEMKFQVSGNLYTARGLPEATMAVSVARMTSS
jgi:hypothetical protein